MGFLWSLTAYARTSGTYPTNPKSISTRITVVIRGLIGDWLGWLGELNRSTVEVSLSRGLTLHGWNAEHGRQAEVMPKEIAHTAHSFYASFHEGEALAQLQIDTLCCVVSGWTGSHHRRTSEPCQAIHASKANLSQDLFKALFHKSLWKSLCIECQPDTNHWCNWFQP